VEISFTSISRVMAYDVKGPEDIVFYREKLCFIVTPLLEECTHYKGKNT
jgi:hypothetical protein